jgi:hypothetical protein
MSVTDPCLPLPVSVLARLRSADSLRVELEAVTLERDNLRAQLDSTAWERDAAQGEAAFMREDVLHSEGYYGDEPRNVGLLLTIGDVPPPPPDDERAEDIALVSLSSGAIYVRSYPRGVAWAQYGQDTTSSDWENLAERGPWVTVKAWGFRDHKAKAEAKRLYRNTIYNAGPGVAPWPESAEWALDAVKQLAHDDSTRFGKEASASAWINAWQTLAGATRSAWSDEHARLARVTAEADSEAES